MAWVRAPGGGALPDDLGDLDDVLVVAHEWLDVVPCTITQVVAPGLVAGLSVVGAFALGQAFGLGEGFDGLLGGGGGGGRK